MKVKPNYKISALTLRNVFDKKTTSRLLICGDIGLEVSTPQNGRTQLLISRSTESKATN